MSRLGALGAVALAVVAWSIVSYQLYDATRVTEAASAPVLGRDDPCNVSVNLNTGFDRHCDLELRLLPRGAPVSLRLDETWEGNVLTQSLAAGTAVSVKTRGAPPPTAARIAQLRVLPAGAQDHLAYNVGNCPGLICGLHDVVVLGARPGGVEELLRVRLGRAGRFELTAGGLALVEPYFPGAGAAQMALQVRTYAWDGAAYVQRGVELRPTPSPTPSPR